VFAPAEPDVIVIHDTSAAAVQLQAPVLFTLVLKVPPPAGTDCDIGEIAYEHDAVGFVGDELWPQPDVITSSSAPNVYRILIKTSLDRSEELQPAITLPSRFRRHVACSTRSCVLRGVTNVDSSHHQVDDVQFDD
jgi:hypothetical protein